MAVWIVRAGSRGEMEQKFLQEGRVYVTWRELDRDLSKLADRQALLGVLGEIYPDAKLARLRNWSSQIWPFVEEMEKGDLVVLPRKTQPAIAIGEINGGYHFESAGPSPYFHWRPVKWLADAIPRFHFGKDLLFSFGAFMTICRIQRNNAEERLVAMRSNGWKAETSVASASLPADLDTEAGVAANQDANYEELARDQIADQIMARFKGHGLTRIVEAILKAQGYTTYRSPEGADGGVDIIAGAGPLGFGSPRLCVEVKSGDSPIDRPTVDKLLGAVSKFGAQEGLFVSWSGFKSNVHKELAASFFRVRLWSQKELLEQLFENYDRLDEDLRAELPLKHVWMLATEGDE
ncbi:MAG: restriction endonuclease [Myxococcota bacterium]